MGEKIPPDDFPLAGEEILAVSSTSLAVKVPLMLREGPLAAHHGLQPGQRPQESGR